MNYISTRGDTEAMPFIDAVLCGLAPDGGLFLPETIPDARDRLDEWRELEYNDLAGRVVRVFMGEEGLSEEVLHRLVLRSCEAFDHPYTTPVLKLRDRLYIQELFHGPTLAFKDLPLQFLGELLQYVLQERDQRLNIVVATSGDTGSAAIHGVHGRPNISIFVLHPEGRVSPVQKLQMTTVIDDNVHNIAIRGSFDDGQAIMKTLLSDLEFKTKYSLGALNSVNFARIAAQVAYYFYGAFRACELSGSDRVRFSVPTGNFGNIFAGYIARRMGAPISGLILATNENDILSRFFATGTYHRGPVHATLSPSMDIQVASNFERYLYYRVGENSAKLKELMDSLTATGQITLPPAEGEHEQADFVAAMGDTDSMLACIRDTFNRDGYLLDPHSAVGVAVAEQHLDDTEDPIVCLGAAHPAKFQKAIQAALGDKAPALDHPLLSHLDELPTRCTVLPADVAAIREHIVSTLG